MASAFTFPLHRPHRTHRSPTKWNKKRQNRALSLNLEDNFVKQDDKESPVVQAVRGTAFEHEDKGSEMVPVEMRMEHSILGSHPTSPDHIQITETLATTTTSDTLVKEHRGTAHNKSPEAKPETTKPETKPDARPSSAQGTFIKLDSHDSDSDSDLNIFPVSESRPLARSASVLSRFFPELSSNSQVLSSPRADAADQTMKSLDYASLFENELKDRPNALYNISADVKEVKGGKSWYSEASDVFDCASSCYSRCTSLSSVNTEWAGERSPLEPADTYSVLDPVQAGVFDDAASIYSSRASSAVSPASRRQSRQAEGVRLSRIGTLASEVSMEELKNKPLPLEPIRKPSPLTIRRYRPTSTDISPQSPSEYLLAPQRLNQHHRVAMGGQQYREVCRECGSHRERCSHREHDSEWHRYGHGQQMGRGPTLSQTAEELEHALANLTKGSRGQPQTVLILDGPPQVSRHNGDLVATRLAPRPPPIAPHSQSHRDGSLETMGSAKDKGIRFKKSYRSTNTSKDHRPSNPRSLSEVSTNETVVEATKLNTSTKKGIKGPKAKDQVKENSQPSAKFSIEEGDKTKLKKSFTLSMPSFSPKDTKARLQKQERDWHLSVLSAGPETSSDLPNNRECLLPHLAPNWSLALTKRDELLSQLPRLQTQDLQTNTLDSLTWDQEQGLTDSTTHRAGLSSANSAGDAARFPMPRVSTPEDEEIPVARDRMRTSQAFVSTARASSVRILPKQLIYELSATPPSPLWPKPVRNNKHVAAIVNFPVDMPRSLIVAMMERIESLDDLFNIALVNKRFYMIFKVRELYMIKNALFKMSPPAWELREMSPPWETEWATLDSRVPEYTPTTYLNRYATDIYTLARLKSMILVRCSPFLRRDTIRGLSGVDPIRLEEVDDAFWRIWTFCRIFGSGKGREDDLEWQVDWLKGGTKARNRTGAVSTMIEPFGIDDVLFEPPEGFARGNHDGLSQKQMYDMTEIWNCLAVLLQPIHAKCADARAVGIFDRMDIAVGDAAREQSALEEWTAYILTLGLSAVVTLSSLCPAEATAETFEKAKSLGLTKWELTESEGSRSPFLKEAVSRAYEEQERGLSTRSDSPHKLISHALGLANVQAERAREERQHAFKVELRAHRLRNVQSNFELGTSFSRERPMSEFSTIIRNLDGSIRRTSGSVHEDVPLVPPLTFERSSTSTRTAPRAPIHTPPPTHVSGPSLPLRSRSPPHPALAPPLEAQIQDPVDRAIRRMVHELGFNEDDVKWALKITDTGEGIDMAAAEGLLKQQRLKQLHNPLAPRGKNGLLHSVTKRQKSQDSGWRWA